MGEGGEGGSQGRGEGEEVKGGGRGRKKSREEGGRSQGRREGQGIACSNARSMRTHNKFLPLSLCLFILCCSS